MNDLHLDLAQQRGFPEPGSLSANDLHLDLAQQRGFPEPGSLSAEPGTSIKVR
jgi:hypothetical protein